EELGGSWLAAHFGPEVTEPVRLHVAAKRYLCATDPAYFAGLSPASVLSLELQGGPLDATEARRFKENPFHSDSLRLRRWDEAAKVPEASVPEVAHYAELLRRLIAHP